MTLTICRLVAYLVANVVKDEKEYREWGLPFVAMSVEAQFGKENSIQILEELDAKFCPLIGHGLSLILEEPESEDYTLVHSAEVLLSSILNEIESSDANFESSLRLYMDKFFHFVLNNQSDDIYDARTRVIARRMCDALNITAAEFSDLESTHWSSESISSLATRSLTEDEDDTTEQSTKSQARRKFYEKFNRDSKNIPRASILASFRIWRVAFIAAGGGALMALSGAIAAPAIMSTVMPLLCASNTLGQVSVGLNTVLSCFGITTLDLIPGIMSSYGAAVAGQKMLQRTAPLKDFALKPLHMEDGDNFEPMDAEGTVVNSIGSDINRTQGKLTNKAHAPVFILVSGHLERGVDARQMWGANGFIQSIVDTAIGTATSTLTGIVQSVSTKEETSKDEMSIEATTITVSSADGNVNDNIVASATVTTTTLTTNETTMTPVSINSPITTIDIPPSTTTTNTTNTNTITDAPTESVTDLTTHTTTVTAVAEESLSDWQAITSHYTGWWRGHISHGEEYLLQWEPSVLEKLHDSLQRIVLDKVFGKLKGIVKGEILKFTPIPGVRAAASLPLMVMRYIEELDDPWVTATDRAAQAGKLLARVLLAEHRRNKDSTTSSRLTGRPITLVGYGMGARLIFHCLETLAAEGGIEARGIVENAVLIGAPVSMDLSKWSAAREVVAGRLVNCYAWNDWILALLYRSKSYEIGVAGLYPINLTTNGSGSISTKAGATVTSAPTVATADDVNASAPPVKPRLLNKHNGSAFEVENFDVSHLITSHADYPRVLPQIIALLNL